jgi:hypothetical protein
MRLLRTPPIALARLSLRSFLNYQYCNVCPTVPWSFSHQSCHCHLFPQYSNPCTGNASIRTLATYGLSSSVPIKYISNEIVSKGEFLSGRFFSFPDEPFRARKHNYFRLISNSRICCPGFLVTYSEGFSYADRDLDIKLSQSH